MPAPVRCLSSLSCCTVMCDTVWFLHGVVVGKCKTPHPALGADGAWDCHSRREVVVYFIRRPPGSSAPSANTAAGLEDPRRLARRAGCRWGEGSLDSVDRSGAQST